MPSFHGGNKQEGYKKSRSASTQSDSGGVTIKGLSFNFSAHQIGENVISHVLVTLEFEKGGIRTITACTVY